MPTLPPTHSTKVDAPTHQSKASEALFKRIRGRKLMGIRERIFRRDPLCVACLAKKPQQINKSVVVDHVTPLHRGGKDIDSNRQGLCDDCHKEKTAREATERSYNPPTIPAKQGEQNNQRFTCV